MIRIEDEIKEENMREYLREVIKYYSLARAKIEIPCNKEELEDLIEELKIELYENKETTGTFNVSQISKSFKVIMNNFNKNGSTRNNFLMLHEMTHFSSVYNKELYTDLKQKKEEIDAMKSIKEDENISGFDVIYGLTAIDEVLSQWCCEECNDAIKETRRGKKKEEHKILGTTISIITDFSDRDIYAPLQQYVEGFAKDIGFKNLSEFAKAMINGEQSLFDKINENNAKILGYIGILCEGIYQDNGFNNFGLPPTDIPLAIKYLDGRLNIVGVPDNPSGNEDGR